MVNPLPNHGLWGVFNLREKVLVGCASARFRLGRLQRKWLFASVDRSPTSGQMAIDGMPKKRKNDLSKTNTPLNSLGMIPNLRKPQYLHLRSSIFYAPPKKQIYNIYINNYIYIIIYITLIYIDDLQWTSGVAIELVNCQLAIILIAWRGMIQVLAISPTELGPGLVQGKILTGKPHDLHGKIDGFRWRFSRENQYKPIHWGFRSSVVAGARRILGRRSHQGFPTTKPRWKITIV